MSNWDLFGSKYGSKSDEQAMYISLLIRPTSILRSKQVPGNKSQLLNSLYIIRRLLSITNRSSLGCYKIIFERRKRYPAESITINCRQQKGFVPSWLFMTTMSSNHVTSTTLGYRGQVKEL